MIIPARKHKLVSSSSFHVGTLELSLEEDLPEKLPNLDAENSKNLENPIV